MTSGTSAGRLPADVSPRLLAGVVLAGTLSVLDSTVVVPLLTGIGDDLGGGTSVSWLVSAYLLASTVTIPVWGRWLDLRGERAPTWTALAAFTAGTAMAVAAPGLGALIAARVVQGVGAGGLVPLGQAILAARCTPPERARLQVFYNVAYGLAAGLGPLVGGALVGVSWRWAFALVLPFALATGGLLVGRLRSGHRPGGVSGDASPRRFDAVGAVLVTAGLVGITLAIERASPWPAVAGLALLGGFGWRVRSRPDGLIPLALLRSRAVLACAGVAGLIGYAQFAFLSYLPALSSAAAPELNPGVVVLPLTLLWMMLGAYTGVLALRVGTRSLALAAAVAAGSAGVVVAASGAMPALLTGSVLAGAAAGLALIPTLLLAQRSAAAVDVGAATALLVLVRNFGGAAGTAATAVLLAGPGRATAFGAVAAAGLLALAPALALPARDREPGRPHRDGVDPG